MHRKASLNILNTARNTYAHRQVYRIVNAADFPHLSRRFYGHVTGELEALGFRHVADVETENLKKNKPNPRTFTRIMANHDGSIRAGMYHICPVLPWRLFMFIFGMRRVKIFEFQSELDNGCHVLTTTASGDLLFLPAPKILLCSKPGKTPVADLLQIHLDTVERVCREDTAGPVHLGTLDEIHESNDRQRVCQHKYLESIGWVTEEYLVRQSGGNKRLAREIYAEIQNILAEEQGDAAQGVEPD